MLFRLRQLANFRAVPLAAASYPKRPIKCKKKHHKHTNARKIPVNTGLVAVSCPASRPIFKPPKTREKANVFGGFLHFRLPHRSAPFRPIKRTKAHQKHTKAHQRQGDAERETVAQGNKPPRALRPTNRTKAHQSTPETRRRRAGDRRPGEEVDGATIRGAAATVCGQRVTDWQGATGRQSKPPPPPGPFDGTTGATVNRSRRREPHRSRQRGRPAGRRQAAPLATLPGV